MRRTVATLRVIHEEAHVVLGHGTHPHPGYAEHADQLVTFSGSWSDYRWSQVAEWTADHPPERFCHFVHGVPRPHLEEALRIARWQGADTIWFTDHSDRVSGRAGPADPWGRCPATGTTSSRVSERVSRNEKGHGSVKRRTTVVIDRSTESPCRCHPWSSRPPSSP